MNGVVAVPGSKSETARALVLAALADGPSRLTGVLASRDSDLMRAGLASLGVGFADDGPALVVTPPDRFVAPGNPIDCGLAGTVMRFLPPVAALACGTTRFVGDEQARRRPMGPVLGALRQLGAEVDGDALPFAVTGHDAPRREASVDASASSQFVSGPLLVGARLPDGLALRHTGDTLPSRPHIAMTCAMLAARGVGVETPDDATWVVSPGPIRALDATIEPDLTTAAVFLAAAAVTGGEVTVTGWSRSSTQPGRAFADVLTQFGADVAEDDDRITVRGAGVRGIDVNLAHASELTPVVAAMAALAEGPTTITGVGYIRGHETDRLAALEAELGAVGAIVAQTADGLEIAGRGPAALHPARLGAHADHRMAHVAALLGLRVAGVTVDDVACTSKTMPTFPDEWTRLVVGL